MWLDRIPASVAFCDVETTGLGKDDCIVSFGGIGMIRDELANGRSHLAYRYLVFDPGKRNHHGAEQVHGFSRLGPGRSGPVRSSRRAGEALSSRPTNFSSPTTRRSTKEFINREMASAVLSPLTRPIYCTMKGYRALGRGGSAALSAVCGHIKLARSGRLHAAIGRCLARHADLSLAARLSFPAQIAGFAASNSANFRHVAVGRQCAPTLITTAGAPVSASSDLGRTYEVGQTTQAHAGTLLCINHARLAHAESILFRAMIKIERTRKSSGGRDYSSLPAQTLDAMAGGRPVELLEKAFEARSLAFWRACRRDGRGL